VTTYERELSFANELADIADEISMKHFRRTDISVRTKDDGTPVTEADEGIERALREHIAATFPDHGILGEEEGESASSSTSRWIIDPIDGTKNYSWGIPIWATLIAFEKDGDVVCGVASAPGLGERYAARRGGGATRNGEPLGVSETTDLSRARVGFTSIHGFDRTPHAEAFRKLVGGAAFDRGIGDFYGHMLVAAGSLDVMVEPDLRPWDLGPLIVIVTEAGGRLTDFSGRAHIYGGPAGVLTTNGRLHTSALALFGAKTAGES
jgi:histidinol-phosphatase